MDDPGLPTPPPSPDEEKFQENPSISGSVEELPHEEKFQENPSLSGSLEDHEDSDSETSVDGKPPEPEFLTEISEENCASESPIPLSSAVDDEDNFIYVNQIEENEPLPATLSLKGLSEFQPDVSEIEPTDDVVEDDPLESDISQPIELVDTIPIINADTDSEAKLVSSKFTDVVLLLHIAFIISFSHSFIKGLLDEIS